MAMKAKINTDALGNIIIHMEGGLDFDTTQPLKRELSQIAEKNPHSTITLNLNKLDFVGSSGIGHFVETLEALNRKRDNIKLCGVSEEFKKIFKLYQFDALEAMIQSFDNDETEELSQNFAARKKTFQN